MSAGRPSRRMPPWLRANLPRGRAFGATSNLVAAHGLRTVCRGANCPNIFECFSRGTATFLILGGTCTRNCAFCNIDSGRPEPPDPDEPRRLAEAVSAMDLRHAVVTSVTRDDLPDGGAGHFAAVIQSLRRTRPQTTVEALIPDFQGDPAALRTVLAAGPDVLNHNVETAPSLYPAVRPQAVYARSLELLSRAADCGVATKSGLMLGLGETMAEARRVVADLVAAGCAMITVGQYLRPSRRHPEPARYAPPEEFEELAAYGRSLGDVRMFCAPLARSSYHARPLDEKSPDGAGAGVA